MGTQNAKRESSWSLLKLLHSNVQGPWFCFGDFNEITGQQEKYGANTCPLRQMASFQTALFHSGLSDLPTAGQRFTWSNKRQGAAFTKERIDRAMANQAGFNPFPGSNCLVLAAIKSNHSLLLIYFLKDHDPIRRRHYIFRFEASWDLHPNCTKLIHEAWGNISSDNQGNVEINSKLTSCKQS